MFRIMEASERFGGGAREGLAMHVQEDRQEWSPGGSCTFRLPCALFLQHSSAFWSKLFHEGQLTGRLFPARIYYPVRVLVRR